MSRTDDDLLQRRARHLGTSWLFYDEPLHLVHGDGVWLDDAAGRRYLDCYNNVQSVGHGNPRVVAAMATQAALLSTHTRYLHEAVVEYAERLTATMPEGLDRCIFVNSGTEANELAMRMARAVTGQRGAVVMEHSYHGNSTLVDELSTLGKPTSRIPPHVATAEPPDRHRGSVGADAEDPGRAYAAFVDDAIARLLERGEGVAAFLCDAIFDSQGGLDAPAGYFARAYESVRAAGGLCIADEVQAGFARTGSMWGFTHHDVVPDIVTFGKPAGNGYPLAGVVTTPAIMDEFSRKAFYFNTFGGNPVAARVGLAVLDEVREHDLGSHVASVGTHLRDQLRSLSEVHPLIGDVRGRGLYWGLDLVRDRSTKEPASDLARRVPDAMRRAGVLLGTTGRFGNVVKIRPPLVFGDEHVEVLIGALDQVLGELGASDASVPSGT